MKIDLHMHTKNSDGADSSQEIINKLAELKADIVSFTDHDSVGVYLDILEGKAKAPQEISVISGVEITSNYNGVIRDILGYGIDVNKMNELLSERYSTEKKIQRQEQFLKEFQKACKDYGLVYSENITITEGRKAEAFIKMFQDLITYPENLIKCPDLKQMTMTQFFWQHYNVQGDPFFVDEASFLPTLEEAVKMIHECNGLAFLAHPFAYGLPYEEVKNFVQYAVSAGIDGIEVKHNTYSVEATKRARELAEKYNKYISGGTDYHGSVKPDIKLITEKDNVKVNLYEIEPWVSKIGFWN